jgi:hypothetical protein
MSRLAFALLALVLVAPACTSEAPGATATATATPRPQPSPSPSASIVINPPGVVVENIAQGKSEKRVTRAIRDLKGVNLWLPLTRHLYKVKFDSRLGAASIPDDGHLADAILTAAFDEEAQGRLCDVMFFPNAIAQDLDRWRLYYQQGATSHPPPTLRHLWASVTAHELGHCFPGGPGEKFAQKWERRTLRRLES